MAFWRKTDAVPMEHRNITINLVALAERVAGSRNWLPYVWLRIGTARTMVYVGSLN